MVLDKTLCALDDHLGHSLVMLRHLIEGRIDNLDIFAMDRLLHVRDFLGALINEQNDQMCVRIPREDRLRDILKERCLARLRR